MRRRTRAIIAAVVVLCLLLVAGWVVYRHTIKDYVDCGRMLAKVYNAEASDLSFDVTINASGTEVESRFRAIRFPFQNTTAAQITLNGKNGDYTFYKIHGRNVEETGDNAENQDAIPRNFMELLEWGRGIYKSDLEINKIRDRSYTTYRVNVPDDMVQSFLDAYLGALDTFNLKYSDCVLTLTGNKGRMTELVLQGTASYRILFVNASANVVIRARVNALDKDVNIPTVPDSVVKGAN